MSTWKWFALWLVSLLGFIVSVSAILFQVGYRVVSKKYDNEKYFHALAVSNTVSISSMLYGSKHTVAAITGQKAHKGDAWHKVQAKVIDCFFGKDYCFLEAVDSKLLEDVFV